MAKKWSANILGCQKTYELMKKLLEFILESIVDKKSFSVEEEADKDTSRIKITADKSVIGIIIGKGGRTIKAIQDVLRIKAKLEKSMVFVEVVEKA